jgi:hypothetical protein
MNIPLSIISIGVSLIASILFNIQSQKRTLYQKIFPFNLSIILVVEFITYDLGSRNLSTVKIYNYFSVFELVFYFFILSQFVTNKSAKKFIGHVLWIYPLLFFLNISFIQEEGFHSMTYSLGCLLIAFICVYYFYELFQLPHSIILYREPPFWICTGLLFFYSCSFPIFSTSNFLSEFPTVILANLEDIISIMNVLLYSMFTIAFLCRIRIRKSM